MLPARPSPKALTFYNPYIQGWINYYGNFVTVEMTVVVMPMRPQQHINGPLAAFA
jgi:hypothetical protein